MQDCHFDQPFQVLCLGSGCRTRSGNVPPPFRVPTTICRSGEALMVRAERARERPRLEAPNCGAELQSCVSTD